MAEASKPPAASQAEKPKTAFVFAGGGSLGAVQVGMLRSLTAHGVKPDMVVGSSVGAMNGAYYAGAPTPEGVEQLATIWRGLRRRDGEPRCGAYIIDARNGDILHWIRFEGAVRELFDAAFIPGVRAPMCVGLGNPEMRTLITFDGEASGSTAAAVA